MGNIHAVRVLFVHRAFPAQFRRLALYLAAQPGISVLGLGDMALLRGRGSSWLAGSGINVLGYEFNEDDHLGGPEVFERRARAVANVALDLRRRGFSPDLVFAHASFGEAVHLKEVFEGAKLIVYCEWFYNAPLMDDREIDLAVLHEEHTRNEHNARILAALEAADVGWAPTQWQRAQFPAQYQAKIAVIHDGIDTDFVRPAVTPDGEPVVTFATRSLEPARGFHVFMRALPETQVRSPQARVVIAGSDIPAYGSARSDGTTHRAALLRELQGRLDLARITFSGMLPYAEFVALLQRSSVHVYATFPFVLSWSLIDALAAGCLIVGSRTPPVEEVIRHGYNGLLFEDASSGLAARGDEALHRPDAQQLRANARRTACECYDWERVCLPAQLRMIRDLMAAHNVKKR